MSEEWRPVDGWPYEVSDHGRVRRASPAMGTQKGAIMGHQKGWGATRGYHAVMLRDHPRAKWFLVHRLVALAFLGPEPFPGAIINHLNGDKLDNRPTNLEWTNRAGNNAHAGRTGLVSYGDSHCHAKLTSEAVAQARMRYASGEIDGVALADEYGVGYESMRNAIIGKTWRRTGGPLAKTITNRRGEDHSQAKLTHSDVVEIKRRLECGDTVKLVAEDYPAVSEPAIYDIAAGRTWKHV